MWPQHRLSHQIDISLALTDANVFTFVFCVELFLSNTSNCVSMSALQDTNTQTHTPTHSSVLSRKTKHGWLHKFLHTTGTVCIGSSWSSKNLNEGKSGQRNEGVKVLRWENTNNFLHTLQWFDNRWWCVSKCK